MQLPYKLSKDINVSRETLQQLDFYTNLLIEWTNKINLIAPSTLPDLWDRHITDCAQLYTYIDPVKPLADLGSGAGLPGIVLAMMGCSEVHLIESDKRKCIFLHEAVRECNLTGSVTIHHERIENCSPLGVYTIVSRACASLPLLLKYAAYHRVKEGKCLFLKGKQVREEITVATSWKLNYTLHPSLTDTNGAIVEITDMEKIHD